MNDQMYNLRNVTRVEVIDETGRRYVRSLIGNVRLAVQDDGRTIKIFVSDKKEEDNA